MTDIVDFLRSRLDEDELFAARGPGGQPIQPADLVWTYEPDTADARDGGSVVARGHRILIDSPMVIAAHVARWDPARALAEVEAKRRLMAEHRDDGDGHCQGCGMNAYEEMCRNIDNCPVLAALASVYAHHPEYDETWRPA
ncbi:hypothetical protein EBO15_01440 [Actinomadura harenae]|uniref:Uncharacterized protein n=2 Tax=Actinomadura harenae TaxID=2483351 RepID=A0A3M2MDG6_9ACTN|nr:hypothetical protein EBO15_01440 [Actinomadura harenae]